MPRVGVRHVQVVGVGGKLGGNRVDALDERRNPPRQPQLADGQLRAVDDRRDAAVVKAEHLGAPQQVGGQGRAAAAARGRRRAERRLVADNRRELVQEPPVHVGQAVDGFDRLAGGQPTGHGQHPPVGRDGHGIGAVRYDARHKAVDRVVADHAEGLLEGLLKRPPNGHHLPDRLHGRPEFPRHARKLVQVPPRHLDDHIVEGRLKAGRRFAGDQVAEDRQRAAERNLGRDKRERVARGLGRERRRPRQPRIDLNDAVLGRVRVERILHVALANNAEMPHRPHRRVAEHIVVRVGERLRRRHNHRVARVHAERVKVLHVAHRHAVALAVADHLILDFLPALHRPLDEHLRGGRQRLGRERPQLGRIVRKARTEAAERKRRAQDDGVADRLCRRQRLVHRLTRAAVGKRFPNFRQARVEAGAVFRILNRPHGRAEHPDAEGRERARLFERQPTVERRLPAKRDEDAVGPLILRHLGHVHGVHGEEVDLVGHALGRLHRRHVGVDEDGADGFRAEGLERLGGGKVKLPSLANGQPPRAEDEHLAQRPRRHGRRGGEAKGRRRRGPDHCRDRVADGRLGAHVRHIQLPPAARREERQEGVKEVGRIPRPGVCFRVELHGKEGAVAVDNPLVGPVIGVGEEREPPPRAGAVRHVDGVAVVLGRDVAAAGRLLDGRLVVAPVAILELVRAVAGRKREQLVAEADAENGARRPPLHRRPQAVNGPRERRRVARPVGDKDAVKVPRCVGRGIVVVKRHARDDRPPLQEAPQLVHLEAAVNDEDAWPGGPRRKGHRVGVVHRHVRGGDGGDQWRRRRVDKRRCGRRPPVGRPVNEQLGEEGPPLPQQLRQAARVNPRNGRHALVRQKGTERRRRRPMRVGFPAIVRHDQRRRVDGRRLEVHGEARRRVDGGRVGRAIVAGQREGEDEQLAAVARVGQRFGVADHARLEDGLAGRRGARPKRPAAELHPVFKDERRADAGRGGRGPTDGGGGVASVAPLGPPLAAP
ncbi:hypothetical protein BU14_0120s0001 [Porphyra umbilicalis]|uniref:Uncharacterized protein n=1 Tax=Porphyra umbilicalis TaxID=2786 RepID=A0A1X6PB88_PORUM|nr:hypothetical protein BU14_0120s0001 [Porphyra umbilicalis]|eukprot:OSX78118.1 hypothetical protein BU14_0120s0001 [Porphyra umbilicalis]